LASLALFGVGARIEAQTFTPNAWTNSSSGNWQDPFWSLGVLPGPTQAILLTNAGWKALAIGPTTVESYPQTLNVGTITVSSPPDTLNVLLLNYAGYGAALTANAITINSNSAMTVLASVLAVTNGTSDSYRLEVGGTVNQGEFPVVSVNFLGLGNVGPGVYNLTNGTLTVGAGNIGGSFTGRFNQLGGFNSVSSLTVSASGEYDLFDGTLGGGIQLNGGVLKQTGGLFNGGLWMGGTYLLQGGLFTGSGMAIPPVATADGSVLQTGGTNQMGGLTLGAIGSDGFHIIVGNGSYTLSNGVLVTTGIVADVGGFLSQSGGIHTNHGAITITGREVAFDDFEAGGYSISGGSVQSDSLDLQLGGISQSGGTNQIMGVVTLNGNFGGTYSLSGGMLSSSTTTLADRGTFSQSGGTHVANALSLAGPGSPSSYNLSAGQVIASNLQLSNGTFHHIGGTLVNPGLLTLGGGVWDEQTSGQQFGALLLVNANSTLSLPTNVCVLRFADSSSLSWSNQATVSIENWAGSLNGNGVHQIIFGSSGSSLTQAQLAQILLDHPNGLASGIYIARILSTGEIVPDTGRPAPPFGLMATTAGSNQIALSWSDRSSIAVQLEVQRSLTNSGFVGVATLGGNATGYLDSSLAPITTYYYRVRAIGTNGDSFSDIASATTEAVGFLPSNWPWTNQDIGPVGLAGRTLYDGAFHVIGSGADIYGFQDAFQYVYFPLYGGVSNVEVVAHITRLDDTNPFAKAGLMIRNDASASAPNAFMFLTPESGSGFQVRPSFGAATSYTSGTGSSPGWVRLVLTYTNVAFISDVITGYVSSDGINWTAVGSATGVLGGAPLIGMAVTAHNNSALCQADFYFRINGLGAAPPAPMLSEIGRPTNGTLKLVVRGDIGHIFGVNVSSDLFHWTAWTNQINSEGSVTFLDTDIASHPWRFYRAYVEP
jgi:hypothetical protein